MARQGTMFGVGVGPGDPSLMTVRAVETITQAKIVAFFAKQGGRGNAFAIAQRHIAAEARQLPLLYPYTTEISARHPTYLEALRTFYDAAAAQLAEHLDQGQDVCVLCEGDPLLYGSYIYLHDRLARRYPTVVVPGITSFSGCAARAGVPLVSANRRLTIVPGTLPEAQLEARLMQTDAAVIIKLGSNFGKVRRVLEKLGKLSGALYFEHGTTPRELAMPLADMQAERSPYFSLILVPSHDVARLGVLGGGAGP